MATQELWEAETGGGVSHIIKRPRLTKILDESEARIILLCAPAGYGKTTLARDWVATRDEPVLWYSGGPAMADVAAMSCFARTATSRRCSTTPIARVSPPTAASTAWAPTKRAARATTSSSRFRRAPWCATSIPANC